MLDHQDWKKRVCDLEHKTGKLWAHPEHWHVTEFCAAIENLRVWMVEDRRRRPGMYWSMRGSASVGEECSAVLEELSDVDNSVESADSSAGTEQDVQNTGQDDGDVGSGLWGGDDSVGHHSSGAACAIQGAELSYLVRNLYWG